MNRKTVTLTDDDSKKLERLVKKMDSDSSKIMRVALRRLYEEQLNLNLKEAYKKYYETEEGDSNELAEDFTGASAPLW